MFLVCHFDPDSSLIILFAALEPKCQKVQIAKSFDTFFFHFLKMDLFMRIKNTLNCEQQRSEK